MFDYPRGSEWRKWDLHMHSAASDGKSSPCEIIEEAKNKGLSVIALTDHHTVSNIDETKQLGEAAGITVISGIEFRTEYGAKSVHMIGLFPNEHGGITLNQQALNDLVLSPLDLSRTRIISEGKKINAQYNDEDAFKAGMFYVQVDFKKAADLVHNLGGIVTVHAGNKSNSIEQMKHEGSGAKNVDLLKDSLGPVKEELLKEYIDICEVQKCSETKFYLKEFGKPSIAASDAHERKDIGSKFTWIKADPTFEGLLQIKFEPEQRVRIQEEKPESKATYSVIDYVTINNPDFTKGSSAKIQFSQDLTCIIGGKSTGKSLLLNNIAYAIDKEQVIQKYQLTQPESKKKQELSFLPIKGFSVHWADGHTSSSKTPLDKKIVYIPQTYLNRLSDEREETTEVDTIIENILLQDDNIQSQYRKYKTLCDKQKVNTDRLLYDYLKSCEDIKKFREKLFENNSSTFIKEEIKKIEAEQKTIISENTVTEEQSQRYNQLCDEIQRLKKEISLCTHDREILGNITTIQLVRPVELTELQSTVKENITGILSELSDTVNSYWISQRDRLIQNIDQKMQKSNEQKNRLETEVNKLRPIIERNATLVALSSRLTKEKAKLTDALQTESIIHEQESLAAEMLVQLVEKFFENKMIADEFASFVNQTKSESVEGLQFKVEIVLRSDALRARLLDILNKKSLHYFNVIDLEKLSEEALTQDTLRLLVESIQSQDSNSLNLKGQYTVKDALSEIFSNWYNMNYIVKMDNDDFEKMSPGKKALVLLKLLIGLANSDCPMLIDQPEDDLDNRSIFDDLVKYIKTKKSERQIIVVTHNANIVVGADSEEIIVANQHGQNTPNKDSKFEYISGSIENSWRNKGESFVLLSQGIKEHICDVLEGGEKAFEKRKNKYFIEN